MADIASKVQEAMRVAELAKKAGEFLSLLHGPDDVFEIRISDCPDKRGGTFLTTAAGWFDNIEQARKAIAAIETIQPPGIYVTLNPCSRDLLSRVRNQILKKQKTTTADENILRRTHIVVDIDPKRPAGISSTEAEMEAGLNCARAVRTWLTEQGWPQPLFGMSGNGAYLIYRVDLPNDEDVKELIRTWLHSLASRFTSELVDIDCSTFNASRIVKVLGTVARKGTEYPGTDRPHRTSWFETPVEPMQVVSREQIGSVANLHRPAPASALDVSHVLPLSESSRALSRARAYLATLPGAIAGQGGSLATLEAACHIHRFAVSGADAMTLLQEYNQRCQPAWSDAELAHKLEDAEKKVRDAGQYGIKLSDTADTDGEQTTTATPGTLTIDDEHTVRAGAILTQLINDLRSGNVAQLIDMGAELRRMEVAAGLITIIGAGPGTGKTALVMQCIFAALQNDETLRAVIANAEMTFSVLLRRELTRQTRIPSERIRFADLTGDELARITEAGSELLPRLDRVRVMQDDYTVAGLLALCNEPPGILVVDYLQKFASAEVEIRIAVGQVMTALRTLAKCGWSVIAISATSRPPRGSNGLTMASLRESSEIEFNADSIYLMNDGGAVDGYDYIRQITMSHAKNRHGPTVDIPLEFHQPRMQFSAPASAPEAEGYPEFGNVVDVDDPFAGES